jgi:transcriptional regulator with XRE-family HTH domain
MSLGTRLKAARLAKNLTQKELGDLVGVTGSAIGNYEKSVSSPNEDTLIRLMSVLEIDANYLYLDDINTPANAVYLNPDEINLISIYRSLNHQGRDLLLTTAQSFAGNPALQKDGAVKAI